ncbi:MAG: glycosyltransferase family 2 protein [Cyanobacteria bacterium J06600_6]
MCDRTENQIFETSSDLSNVIVIIPTLNEEVTIVGVIQDLQSYGLSKIRVVDNGSSDRSADLAASAGAEVLFESQAGYGQACWRGLQDIPQEINWILFCDGDGSDDLSCLPEFFRLGQQYDLILGDRRGTPQGKAGMTPVQHFGNGLSGWLINLGWGFKYHDLGPLRLIRRRDLERIAMQDRGFGWTVEMQVRAVELDLKIIEIPVNYRPRQGGKSKISGTISGSFQAGTIILSTLGKLYWQKFFARRKRSSQKQSSTAINYSLWISALCLLIGTVAISPYGDFRQAGNVLKFGYGSALMCLGFIVSWRLKSLSAQWFWLIAIATRFILLFMYPGDDIWRYLWEGKIQNLGFSPYDFAPNAQELITYRPEWWSQINHPRVSAIYPPLTQLGFRGLAAITPSVLLFKSSFAIADLLTCWLLSRKFTYAEATFYAWNPLIIYIFAGGGHYDSWFILPLVAAWIAWDQKNKISSGLLIGMSIAVKWISLPLLGFITWIALLRVNFKTAMLIAVCGIMPICLSALAFCSPDSCALIPTSSTFVSHGRSAEFIPRLLAKFWRYSTTTNSLFALPLGLVTACLCLRVKDFQQFAIGFFAALLLISPIIHGWYFTWIIPFAVGTKNWGVRLVSITAFIYFVLPYRQALGNSHWQLTNLETYLLWLPFVLGLGWSYWTNSKPIDTRN